MQPATVGRVDHKIDIDTIEDYFQTYLGYSPYADIDAEDWLCFPEHKLLGVSSGNVFHDGLGTLEPLRRLFTYYRQPVWLFILAAQWQKSRRRKHFWGDAAKWTTSWDRRSLRQDRSGI